MSVDTQVGKRESVSSVRAGGNQATTKMMNADRSALNDSVYQNIHNDTGMSDHILQPIGGPQLN
jgi:hypothetical protein